MRPVGPVIRFCLLMCAIGTTGKLLAQAPVFNFNAADSPAELYADVWADDLWDWPWDADTGTSFGFYTPFTFSGGTVDWGNTLNIVAQDWWVTSSANPLARLDGDGTQRISIAWKGFDILSVVDTGDYYGDADADVFSTLHLTLDGLIPNQDYTIFYQWTAEGVADEEHEAVQEDPAYAAGWLQFGVGGFGPGLAFNRAVDNMGTAPQAIFLAESGAFDVHSSGTSLPVMVDVGAMAYCEFQDPIGEDLVLTIFRGTLNLTVFGDPIPGIIISEVVDGDLTGGTPKFVELTNCGYFDWVFGPDDFLAIYFNGNTTAGAVVDLNGIALAVGGSYVIASSLNSGIANYQAAYGDDADLYVDLPFGNGNDVYSLESGPDVIDTYGIIGVDGIGQDWCYENGYAYSKPCRAPNLGIFDADDWRIGGSDSLAGSSDAQRIALLRARTTPKTHGCFCEYTTAFHDNFETDRGWSVESDPGVTGGEWERGVPINDPYWAYDPVSDSDGSGQCYLTENAPGDSDVDDGAVRLTSPTIDMSGGDITISYDYYLNLSDPTGAVDRLLVEIDSNNGAGPWTEIAVHDTSGGVSWRHHVITEAELYAHGVVLTPTMKVRFTANDADPQSVVEAGVDAFLVTGRVCGPPPFCFGDLDGDSDIDLADLAQLLSNYGMTSGARYVDGDLDLDGDVDLSDLAALLAVYGTTCP
ncbi:MAG: hypothetical protein KKI02_01270 [Planctomycetes bacterium]|nr:hypothetical protein [Planctomycetota bacterium]